MAEVFGAEHGPAKMWLNHHDYGHFTLRQCWHAGVGEPQELRAVDQRATYQSLLRATMPTPPTLAPTPKWPAAPITVPEDTPPAQSSGTTEPATPW